MKLAIHVWGRRIALFLVLLAFARSVFACGQWIFGNWQHFVAWVSVKENEAWSGWAQAFGAVAGILLAVAVPAYQRYAQSVDKRREDADRETTQALCCFYLLGDVCRYIERLAVLTNAPRGRAGDFRTVDTLLTRINTLEAKETDWRRATMLYHARNNLLFADGFTRAGDIALPFDSSTIVLIKGYIEFLRTLEEQAKIESDYRGQAAAKMHCGFFARIVFYLAPNATRLPGEKH